MDYPIRSVTFGGFDRQDVIRYIENFSRGAAAEKRELQEENTALTEELTRLRARVAELEDEMGRLSVRANGAEAQRDALEEKLRRAEEQRETLRPQTELEQENEKLRSEAAQLRRDAAAYARFRERLGAIECEARERADEIETAASERVRRTLTDFQSQYQDLLHAMESAAGHVSGELRRVEYNLSQLPRAMDQAGRELNALTGRVVGEEEPPESPPPNGAGPEGS